VQQDIADSLRIRNRRLIQRFYDEIWNRFDKDLIPVLLTEDLRIRGSLGQNKNGHAQFAEYVDPSGELFRI
jgi:hypothetical protein